MELSSALPHMPSVQQWISQVLDDLQVGRSVLAILPEGVDSDVLRAALWGAQGDLYFEGIFLSQVDERRPAGAVAEALGLRSDAAVLRSVRELVSHTDLPDVMFLDDYDELSEQRRVTWLRFMMEWAEVCQGRQFPNKSDPTVAPALCLVVHASEIPTTVTLSKIPSVLLSIQVWWGVPTTLEMRLLCRLASEPESVAAGRWREFMVPSIAGSDVGLAEYMLVRQFRSGAELMDILRAFSIEKGWTQDELDEAWIIGFPWDEATTIQGRLWNYPFFLLGLVGCSIGHLNMV